MTTLFPLNRTVKEVISVTTFQLYNELNGTVGLILIKCSRNSSSVPFLMIQNVSFTYLQLSPINMKSHQSSVMPMRQLTPIYV